MSDRLKALEERFESQQALIVDLRAQLSELKGAPPPASAAHLFPGVWRKTWTAQGNSGSEVFRVNGPRLHLLSSDAGVRTTWTLELVEDNETGVRLRQTHGSGLDCFPACEIELQRTRNGFEGAEVANGTTIRVTYEPAEEPPARERQTVMAE